MRIKTHPEDFCVKEILDLKFSDGPYSYYLLKKRNMNLFHVLEIVSKKWKISRDRIGFSGIKDRKALTEQYLSIREGPEENLKGRDFEISFIGKGVKPIRIGDAEGNLFKVKVREAPAEKIARSFKIIGSIGFANYFGKQRFTPDLYTSVPIGRLLIEGKFEEALKTYFSHHPSPHIRRALKNGWDRASQILSGLSGLSKMDEIVLKRYIKKRDAEYALRAYPKAVKLMFLFSYQSLIWNRVLRELVREKAKTFDVTLKKGEKISFYISLSEKIKSILHLELPYVSASAYSYPEEIRERLLRWIKKENLEPYLEKEVLGLKAFSEGKRRIIVFPEKMEIVEMTPKSITVQFFLPSGSYATIFLLKLLNYPV